MKANVPTVLLLTSLLLAPAVFAEAPARSAGTAASAATGALPPRTVPELQAVPMDAPPPSPRPTRSPEEEDQALLDADAPDDEEVSEEIQKDSADIEAVREAEERTGLAAKPDAAAGAQRSAAGLGLESPLRGPVSGALEREVAPPPAVGSGRIALLPEVAMDLATLQAEYDIPIEVNAAVVAYIRFFQTDVTRKHFVKWLGRSFKYLDRYRAILREHGLPEDTVYLAMIESGFGNFAYSRAKASGPWQFISATGKMFGLKQDFWVDERRDPERSAHAAARYLKQLFEQTGDWRLAWAGYNAGVGRIFKAQRAGEQDFWEMAEGRVLHPETRGYVPKLMAAAIIAKHPEAFGFMPEEIERAAWTDYEEVEVPNATLLAVLARAAGVSERDIIDLNPELRRACTPPRPYKVKIPRSSTETFAANWPSMKDKVRMTFAGHTVRRGDTLARIAKRYGVPVQGIADMNGLNGVRTARKLKPGLELVIPRPVGSALAEARLQARDEPSLAGAVRPASRSRTTVAVVDDAPARSSKAHARVAKAAKVAKPTHKVRAGDTLWSISQRFGVELDDLCRMNGIRDPHRYKLVVGKKLVVGSQRG